MYKLLKLNLARNSLRYIIKTYNIRELNVPYYTCDTLFSAIRKENCKIRFYHIDNNFFPDKDFKPEDFILYPNYFGICDNNVKILAEKFSRLIVDNAHSFYSEPKGFACFNSARKFLPVFYGSYLWIKDVKCEIPTENNKYDILENEENFIKKENEFANYEIKLLDNFTEEKINSFNNLKERNEKFLNYHKIFGGDNELVIDKENCFSPFCYPFLARTDEQADNLVNILMKQNKKIYRYWQALPRNYNEYKFYKRLVAIPI